MSIDRLDHTREIAEHIRHEVEEHIFRCRGKELHCTLTLGVAGHRVGNAVEDTISTQTAGSIMESRTVRTAL